MSDNKKEEKTIVVFFRYHFPFILYASIVIYLSSLSNLKTPEIRFLAFDKVAHFFEYAIFAFLAIRSFTIISIKTSQFRAFLFTALFIIIFAVFDEFFVQSLSRRNSSIYDLSADVGGAIIVLFIFWILKGKKQ